MEKQTFISSEITQNAGGKGVALVIRNTNVEARGK